MSDSGEIICGCPEDIHGEFCDDSEYFRFLHSNGLCTLSDMDSDPDPGTNIHPQNEYSNNWRSRSGSESVQCEQFLYSTM